MAVINGNEVFFGIIGQVSETGTPVGITKMFIPGVITFDVGIAEITEEKEDNGG